MGKESMFLTTREVLNEFQLGHSEDDLEAISKSLKEEMS